MKVMRCLMLACLFPALKSCIVVKPYQRIYLNDIDMQMGKKSIQDFDGNVHVNREGAGGGGSEKSSGGCGCN